jgi:crotonobetainyl-CoA:carnitine CoA-transferase CaiB-like acyl-CoA transferase
MDALAADERFRTNAGRTTHYDDLRPLLVRTLITRDLDDLMRALRAADVPCGAVRSVEEALTDPQTLAREMVQTLTHPTIGKLQTLGLPVKLSDTPGAIRTPPPRLGEHTRRILEEELAVDAQALTALQSSGVVGIA